MTNMEKVIEFEKCRRNPLYFIMNYCKAKVVGGEVLMDKNNLLPKHRAVIKAFYRLHDVIFFASRRSYKSTLTAALMLWGITFFPGYRIVIINYDKSTAKENLLMVKFMYELLPDFLKIPKKWKAEKIEYFELKNGSRIDIKIPSPQRPPEQLGRGFNYPFVYIDEAAFLPLDRIYGSILPAYESAARQAAANNYPYGMILTSTPNGRQGIGEQFFLTYTNAVSMDELYDYETEKWKYEDPVKALREIRESNPTKNNFVKIKLHWSEFPDRDDSWAESVKRSIEYYTTIKGKRRWNQEYDLLFLGSDNSIFDDDTISKFTSKKPLKEIDVGYGAKLKLWDDLTSDDFYVIGIDTAKSVVGDFSAIEIYNKHFIQVGELQYRFGKVTRFVDVIKKIVKMLVDKKCKFMLFIENNSYGNQVVEELEYSSDNINYLSYMYSYKKGNSIEYGIQTNSKTKDTMVNAFYEMVVEEPKRIKSNELISELGVIEIKNGKISAAKGFHDDLFMASCFAAYGYRYLIKTGEIIYDPEELEKKNKQMDMILSDIVIHDPKGNYKKKINEKEKTYDYNDSSNDLVILL